MAAYASAGGLDPLIFIPNGNISYGKLAQALEYGAKTFQVDANFDQILALVRVLTERLGIYLLNSINPFRIEGQKLIVIEMMDQRDWTPPDWIVLPGGNLGNTSAFGKGLREMYELGRKAEPYESKWLIELARVYGQTDDKAKLIAVLKDLRAKAKVVVQKLTEVSERNSKIFQRSRPNIEMEDPSRATG